MANGKTSKVFPCLPALFLKICPCSEGQRRITYFFCKLHLVLDEWVVNCSVSVPNETCNYQILGGLVSGLFTEVLIRHWPYFCRKWATVKHNKTDTQVPSVLVAHKVSPKLWQRHLCRNCKAGVLYSLLGFC